MTEPRDQVEALLLHDGYVRRLARCLVLDASTADDLAQDTMLVALTRGERVRSSLRAWLRGIAVRLAQKRFRGEARRRRHETLAATSEHEGASGASSPERILAREAARREIVDAVLALDPLHREVVVLRFFDNLPPRAISKRLDVPVATVHSRTKRALDELRARLAPSRAWPSLALLAQLPSAVPTAAGAGTALRAGSGTGTGAAAGTGVAAGTGATAGTGAATGASTGVAASTWSAAGAASVTLLNLFSMSTNAKLGLLGAALLGALALALFSSGLVPSGLGPEPGPESRRAGAMTSSHPAAATRPESGTKAPVRERVAESRNRQGDADDDKPGSLELRLLWARDHSPAVDLEVWMLEHARPNPWASHRDGRSDGHGTLRFEGVLPGEITLSTDRGTKEQAVVRPGAETKLTLELPNGYEVHGSVVDAKGAPVAGADVWLSDATLQFEGHVVARSGQDGSFVLRSVVGKRGVWAQAAGHAPSGRAGLQGSDDALVEIKLALRGPGGALRGTVLDAGGAPVPGALALVGPKGFNETMSPQRFLTDAQGRFLATSVATGTNDVFVRARTFVGWRGPVEVLAGDTRDLEVRLRKGATLTGTVRTSEGAPVPNAWLGFGSYGPIGVTTKSGRDGTYKLDGLPDGELSFGVETEGFGRTRTKLVVAAGADLRWDPVLPVGLSVRGRVVDDLGRPVANWWVELHDQEDPPPDERDSDVVTSAADGTFRFRGVHDRDHVLKAQPQSGLEFWAEGRLEHVRPGDKEHVIVTRGMARSVRITGTLLDADGMPCIAAKISASEASLESYGGNTFVLPKAATGRFELGPYPHGDWSLAITAPNAGELQFGPKTLKGNDVWNLGTIRIPRPGSVAVRIERAQGVPADLALDLHLTRRGSAVQTQFRSERERHEEGERLLSGPLPPGVYAVRATGKSGASEVVPFSVLAGETAEVRVPVVPTAWRRIRVEQSTPDPMLLKAQLVVRSAEGALAYEGAIGRRTRTAPFELALPLGPGTYSVLVMTATGQRAEGSLVVADLRSSEEPVALTLR